TGSRGPRLSHEANPGCRREHREAWEVDNREGRTPAEKPCATVSASIRGENACADMEFRDGYQVLQECVFAPPCSPGASNRAVHARAADRPGDAGRGGPNQPDPRPLRAV